MKESNYIVKIPCQHHLNFLRSLLFSSFLVKLIYQPAKGHNDCNTVKTVTNDQVTISSALQGIFLRYVYMHYINIIFNNS